MQRLSRQFTCPKRISRALRPSASGSALPAALGRKYASSGPPKRPSDKFDRLFASLRPGMKEDELAMTVAALLMSTRNKTKLESLETTIPRYMKGLNQQSLHKKISHYIDNPPRDNFDSLAAPLNSDLLEESSTSEPQPTLPVDAAETLQESEVPEEVKEYDSSLPSPFEQLMTHMGSTKVQQTLQMLEPEEISELRHFLTEAAKISEDMKALDRVALWLSKHGIGIKYSNRIQPTKKEEIDYFAELRAGYIARGVDPAVLDAEEAAFRESKASRWSRESSEIGMAKRAAEDPSLGPVALRAEDFRDPYPDLMTPDPLMDSRDVMEFPPDKENPYHNRVIIRNHTSIFNEALEEDGYKFDMDTYKPTTTDETEESASSRENLALTPAELRNLYRFPLIRRRITQQTGKGKIHRQFVLMVVGNGDGLVGYGQGKDEDTTRAEAKAYAQAVRNMDWVERFEKRTIWTEMDSKLGATQLIMRPRPVGFGLRCNPNLHQVLKAAGIKDISAKVWGSRNPINVIKAAFRMLQAGHAPLAMGDGIGGPGRKLNKGSGLRSKGDVERERGRQLIGLRK